jgi:hypothetical protein
MGIGIGIQLAKKPYPKVMSAIGGLSAILFELVIGGWLVFQALML